MSFLKDQPLLSNSADSRIYSIITHRGLTQVEAAKDLGIQQTHVSALIRTRTGSLSIGRLIDFLTAQGQDVEIMEGPARKEQGAMSIVFE